MERVSILALLYWREQYPCRGQAGLRRAYRLTSSGIITQGCIYAVVYSVQRRKSESKNHIISRGTDLRDITTWTTAPTQPVSFLFARVRYRVLCTMLYWQQPIAVPGRIPAFLWLDGPFAVFSSMRVV